MTTGQSAYTTVADPELEISWEGGAVCALKGNASTLVDVRVVFTSEKTYALVLRNAEFVSNFVFY